MGDWVKWVKRVTGLNGFEACPERSEGSHGITVNGVRGLNGFELQENAGNICSENPRCEASVSSAFHMSDVIKLITMNRPLKLTYGTLLPEAGCDEAGRGCLAGPVTAAAVILPEKPDGLLLEGLNDSKQLSPSERQRLRILIESEALAYGVSSVDHHTIDRINILQASIRAMHAALDMLSLKPAHILVDGRHFNAYRDIPHMCLVKGDAGYLSIAAASILAKVHRDELMMELHGEHPEYGWDANKGYPTPGHRTAILKYGLSRYHRKSFRVNMQQRLAL